jgi:nucleoside-diphosphate-sugar epimerase
MKDMVAVVGGSGFIGTRFCHELTQAKISFRIIDKVISGTFPAHTVVADVTNAESLLRAMKGCNVIVNLAAEHRDDVQPRSRYFQVNVEGAKNVCDVASALSIQRVLFTSTVAVYGYATPDTSENGVIAPFNDYGRSKAEAELVYREWQRAEPEGRTLVIVRPTVVFGEGNRGNVYNLLRQISSGLFVMIGSGQNRKSMAYVGNVSAFLKHMLSTEAGVHVCNYVDKPDLTMMELANIARSAFGKEGVRVPRVPYAVGYMVGAMFDAASFVLKRRFQISRIRVKKFCATTQFSSAAGCYRFNAPYSLRQGIEATLSSDFLSGPSCGPLFFSE